MSPAAVAHHVAGPPGGRWSPLARVKDRQAAYTPLQQASMLGRTVPAVRFEDRVDRANSATTPGSASTGEAWTADRGTWGTLGNPVGLLYNVDNVVDALATVDSAVGADGDLRCVYTYIANGAEPGGITFRGVDATNYLFLGLDATSRVRLRKCVAGVYTTLVTDATVAIVTATTYGLWVRRVGAAISVYLNRALLFSHTLTGGDEVTFASGAKVGLRSNGAAGTTQRWCELRDDPIGATALVATCTDLIGSADALQATASKQILLCWDGTVWVWRCRSSIMVAPMLTASQAGYIAVAVRHMRQPTASTQALWGFGDEASSNKFMRFRLESGRFQYHWMNGGTADQIRGGTTLATPAVPYVVECYSSGAAIGIRYQGVAETLVVQSGANSGNWTADLTGPDNFTIAGSKINTEINLCDTVDIAGIFVATSVPPTAVMDRIYRFMRFNWLGLRMGSYVATGELVLIDAKLDAGDLPTSETVSKSQITDYGGYARHIRRVSGGEITLMHDGSRWLYRLNAVQATYIQSLAFTAIAQPLTVYFACKIRSDTGLEQRILDGSSSTGLRMKRSTNGRVNAFTGSQTPAGVHTDDLVPHIWRTHANGVASDFYRDGLNSGQQNLGSEAIPQLTVGSNPAGTSLHAQLDLYAMRVWSGIRSDAQSLTTETTLAADYTIPLYSNADLDVWGIGALTDADGSCLLTSGGKEHVVTVQTSTGVYLFQQGATLKAWTRWALKETGFTEIQGVAAGDFDGDGKVEIFAFDQGAGTLWLLKQPGATPFATGWTAVKIHDGTRQRLQSALVWDDDGDGRPELHYAWEGFGIGSGGWNRLDWISGDVMTPGNWTDSVMAQRMGAWGMAHANGDSTRYLLDLAGGGAKDIVVSSRFAGNQGPDAGGLHWLSQPAVKTDPWPSTVIIDDGNDWSRCDVGDFTGDGTRKDVVAMVAEPPLGPRTLNVFRHSTGWTREVIWSPASHDLYNCWVDPQPSGRDRIYAVVEYEGLYRLTWAAGVWTPVLVLPVNLGHPMDNRVWLRDLGDGSGVARYVTGAGECNQAMWFRNLT